MQGWTGDFGVRREVSDGVIDRKIKGLYDEGMVQFKSQERFGKCMFARFQDAIEPRDFIRRTVEGGLCTPCEWLSDDKPPVHRLILPPQRHKAMNSKELKEAGNSMVGIPDVAGDVGNEVISLIFLFDTPCENHKDGISAGRILNDCGIMRNLVYVSCFIRNLQAPFICLDSGRYSIQEMLR